jgi:hypothetical protein
MPRFAVSAVRPLLAISLLLSVLGAGLAWSAPLKGSVNFTLGGRKMSNEWNLSTPTTDTHGDTLHDKVNQPALGAEVTLGPESWPVQIAADLLYSSDDGVQEYPANNLFDIPKVQVHKRASTLELALGARRAFPFKWSTPYIGAGFSLFRAQLASEMVDPDAGRWGEQLDAVAEHNWAPGYWFGGGIYRALGPRFQMGLTLRFSKAQMKFTNRGQVVGEQGGYVFVPHTGDDKIDVGGRHIGLVVGWSFPARK